MIIMTKEKEKESALQLLEIILEVCILGVTQNMGWFD